MSRGPCLYVRTNASSSLNATTAAAHPKVETLESSVGKDTRVAIRRAERIVCSLAWASSCDTRRSSFLGYLFCLGRAPLRCLTFQCVSCLRCQRWRPSWCGVARIPQLSNRVWRSAAAAAQTPPPIRCQRRSANTVARQPPHSRQRRRGHSAAVAAAALQTRPPRPPPGRHRRPVFPTPPPLGRHRHQSVATDPPPLSRRRHHCLAAAAATQPLPPPQPFSRRPRGR